MPFTPAVASGISFTFDGAAYTATQISVSRNAGEIDCTSTDIPDDGVRRFRASDIENCEIKVDWIGLKVPKVDGTANFTLSSGLYHTGSKALCTGLSITAAAGDLIKGSATFKVST